MSTRPMLFALLAVVAMTGRGRTYCQTPINNVPVKNKKTDKLPANTSRYRVKLIEIEGVNTRRFSCNVSFEVVDVIHDAFALAPATKGSPNTKKVERAKRGSPVDGKLTAKIYQGSDVQYDEDSITRLLTFLGAKNVEGYVRQQGPYKIDKKENLILTVTHAKYSGDIRWEFRDQKGRRAIIKPRKSSR